MTAHPGRSARLPPAYRAVLLAAGLYALWTLFWQVSVLALLALLTVILALPLTAATDRLEALHVPRPAGAIATMLVALGAVAGFVMLVAPTVIAQGERLIEDLPALVDRVGGRFGLGGEGPGVSSTGLEAQALLRDFFGSTNGLIGPLTTVVTNIVALLGGVVIVLITAVYAAVNPRPLVEGLLRLAPPERRPHARHVLRRLGSDWLGWLKGTAIDAVLTGVLTFAALSLLGIEHALVFALITAVLEVVPYFGPILAAVPPVLYALTQSVELALLTLAVYTVIQQVEGNVIVPLVMSRTVRLHPAVLAVGVVVIGQLFGLLGVLLAVPILSAIVVLTQELWVLPHERRSEAPRAFPDGTGAGARAARGESDASPRPMRSPA